MSVLLDSYSESNADAVANLFSGGFTGLAQVFKPTSTAGITSSIGYIKKVGSPTGTVVSKIYATSGTFGTTAVPTGTALATSDAVTVSGLSTSSTLQTFTFSSSHPSLTSGTAYAISFEYSSGNSTNYVGVSYDSSSPTHAGNSAGNNSGWLGVSTNDVPFYVYGEITPVASFTKNVSTLNKNDTVYFTDTSTNSPTSWLWDFGDSNTSTSQNPSHTYSTAGTFTVTLTATNAGGSNSTTTSVTVVSPRTITGLPSISNVSSVTF